MKTIQFTMEMDVDNALLDLPIELERIAEQIREGYTSGTKPYWNLEENEHIK